ncbi:unnamed protein product [Closterium sp. NIES-53]
MHPPCEQQQTGLPAQLLSPPHSASPPTLPPPTAQNQPPPTPTAPPSPASPLPPSSPPPLPLRARAAHRTPLRRPDPLHQLDSVLLENPVRRPGICAGPKG